MIAARAIVTERGGSTSHAAVVGRSLGRPCIVGCGTDTLLPLAGRTVTVDGSAGRIYAGELTVDSPDEDADPVLQPLLQWAERRSPVQVLKSSPPGQPIADLDNLADIQDPKNDAQLHAYLGDLPPGYAVRGRALGSEAVVAACVRQGIRTLIACPRLPVLLAAVRAAPN
jgi:pyruvate,orthophosphate dikinase